MIGSGSGVSPWPIYLDHHATTPVHPEVLKRMIPYFAEKIGNPASVDHLYGSEAGSAVEHARSQVADLVGSRPDEIIFTSGATESNNLAILGTAEQLSSRGRHIITSVVEHNAVLDPCRYLETQGWEITYLAVDRYGQVEPEEVRKAIKPTTVLVTLMLANNEIGTLLRVAEVGQIAHECGIVFHTDATQAVGHVPVNVEAMSIDLLSLSAHKFYGPKGVGALYMRRLSPRVRLTPRVLGGGHERGMRSGTLNVPGIVGLGAAAELTREDLQVEADRVSALRDRLWLYLQDQVSGVHLNGHPARRLPHNLNVAIDGVDARSLIVQLRDDVAFSTGSACTAAKAQPSHVISALGFGEGRAYCSVRFGLGRSTTLGDIDFVAERLHSAVDRLRALAPPTTTGKPSRTHVLHGE